MTHNQRVLRLLSDGRPHSHHELYALHVVAHSRVSDLRRQGHRIEQWREGDLYLYRLLDGDGGAAAAPRARRELTSAVSVEQPAPIAPAAPPVPVSEGLVTHAGSFPGVAVDGDAPSDGSETGQLSLEDVAA